MNAIAWLYNEKAHLTNSGSTMKDYEQKTDMGLVTSFIGRWWWPVVAVLDVLIFVDIVINGGKTILFLMFFFTGGYRGA